MTYHTYHQRLEYEWKLLRFRRLHVFILGC